MRTTLAVISLMYLLFMIPASADAQHPVLPGSTNNKLNLGVTNVSELLPLEDGVTEILGYSGIVSHMMPGPDPPDFYPVPVDPPDLAPGESGTAPYFYDIDPDAELGEYGYMVFLLTSQRGDSIYLEVEVIASTVSGDQSGDTPRAAVLFQNHPNPFNPNTSIQFYIPRREQVSLKVYDVSGKLVRTLVDDRLDGGSHTYIWDGKNNRGKAVASGVYFYMLRSDSIRKARKAVLLR
jgi:hypothetical protein